MSGFTEKEIKEELDRRASERKGGVQWTNGDKPDTSCLHCGTPMHSWQATDAENPICDTCL